MPKYLRYRDLKPEKGIDFTRQHIKRLQKELKFPLSVPFGDNTEVFIDEELDAWVAARVAERDAKVAKLRDEAQKAAPVLDGGRSATADIAGKSIRKAKATIGVAGGAEVRR
jgi:prophage regulatory protein